VWEHINANKMHLIKRGFVKGHKTWSHHGEAESTFNNADIGTRYDEVGDEDADENDNVMMDDCDAPGFQPGSLTLMIRPT
jgi:hypothetical protein